MDETTRKLFGQWLMRERTSRGWTQRQLAEKLNISHGIISHYERGISVSKTGKRIKPGEDIVERMAAVFRVPLSEVRQMAGYSATESPDISIIDQIVSRLRGLPPDKLDLALENVNAIYARWGVEPQPSDGDDPIWHTKNQDKKS